MGSNAHHPFLCAFHFISFHFPSFSSLVLCVHRYYIIGLLGHVVFSYVGLLRSKQIFVDQCAWCVCSPSSLGLARSCVALVSKLQARCAVIVCHVNPATDPSLCSAIICSDGTCRPVPPSIIHRMYVGVYTLCNCFFVVALVHIFYAC